MGGGTAMSGVTLTVVSDGIAPASGSVTSTPNGIDCPGTCMLVLDAGTTVQLTALPTNGRSLLTGWSGVCADAGTSCSFVLDTDTSVTATFDSHNVMFVTSGTIAPMNIGGLDGGDALCRAYAADAGLAYPSSFVAYLALDGGNAYGRITATGARGWVRPDGLPFADTMAALQQGQQLYPPRLDEHGVDLVPNPQVGLYTAQSVVTGQPAPGFPQYVTCGNYTKMETGFGQAGMVVGAMYNWQSGYAMFCGSPAHLYCFGTHNAYPVIANARGRLAFVTDHGYAATTIAGYDKACDDEAADAGYQGSFRAFLATTTAPAASRFDAGMGWVRPDGVVLVEQATDLFMLPPKLKSAPNVTATMHYVDQPVKTSGVMPDGGATMTCNNWTTTDAGSKYDFGDSAHSDGYPFTNLLTPKACNDTSTASSLYCFER
jgi:hypothetical protein